MKKLWLFNLLFFLFLFIQDSRAEDTLQGHTHVVLSVSFSPDGQLIASGSGDGTGLLWDVSPYTTPQTPNSDFDGDRTVGFPDFLRFAAQFGLSQGDAGYDAQYDLDGDGTVGFSDFLVFAASFGKEVSPPAASKLYWTDADTNKIQRANLDGSNIEDLLISTDGLVDPSGLAVGTAAVSSGSSGGIPTTRMAFNHPVGAQAGSQVMDKKEAPAPCSSSRWSKSSRTPITPAQQARGRQT